jgi:arabinofuranosyltransferase
MSLVSVLSGRTRAGRPADSSAADPNPRTIARWNRAMVLLPATIVLLLGWHRRWISDDGLIFTRTVRQILAGHGPVFNVGERAESSTSTLWQWVLVAASWITRMDVGRLAVYLGLLCTAAGYALALAATRRLYTRDRATPVLVPLGVLALIALPPVWDFATSGLETGLTTLWTAGCWWLLVRLRHDRRARVSYGLAFLAGLGPMVRPDLAIATLGFLIAVAVLVRPRPRRVLGLLGTAVALPLAYEIFRAGYYGVLLPLPAVTKEASATDWPRGWGYVRDFVGPYHLWLPIAILLWFVLMRIALRMFGEDRAFRRLREIDREGWNRITVHAVPVLCGIAMLVYVIRVGGDFMHARMLLPGLFTLLLPILLVPARRLALPAVVVLIGWGLVCAIALRVPYQGIGPRGIADERAFYVDALDVRNPVTARSYIANYPRFPDAARAAKADYDHVLVYPWYDGFYVTKLRPNSPAPVGTVWTNLGMNGANTPLDGASVDILGLAYPLAAHVALTERGRPGHEKEINIEWVFAQNADPDAVLPPGIDPIRVKAARYALTCGSENRGKLKELQDSVQEPLSWSRFKKNLTGSLDRTSFRFPNDPVVAAKEICGVDVLAPGVLPPDKPTR